MDSFLGSLTPIPEHERQHRPAAKAKETASSDSTVSTSA